MNHLKILQDFHKLTGKSPTTRDLPEFRNQITYTYGTWNKALEAAELPINQTKKNWTNEECLEAIRFFEREFGKKPKAKDFVGDESYPSYSTVQRRFGSWNKAIEAAGFIPARRIWDRESIKPAIYTLYEQLKRVPEVKDLYYNDSVPTYGTIIKFYENFETCLIESNIPVRQYPDIETLKKLYIEENLSMTTVGKLTGYSNTVIGNLLRDSNIEKNRQSYSDLEFSIKQFLTENNINYLHNDRTQLRPLELDFYLPDHKIGLEICGLYWHRDREDKNKYHILNKYNLCLSKGIRLLTIFEDEIKNKKKIVLSRLSYILKLSSVKKFHARKCQIKEIFPREGIDFLNSHHIQGSGNNSIYLGAHYNNELISVMSFSKPSIAKGSFNATWELNRFAVSGNISGIANKMFKYFLQNYEWKSIISYCDKRWNTGEVYAKLGFTKLKDSQPNYWYCKPGQEVRLHRWNFTKHKLLEITGLSEEYTELELAAHLKLYRIYDCGNMRFIYNGY